MNTPLTVLAPCPCCRQPGREDSITPAWQHCDYCSHRWTQASENGSTARYDQLQQRNDVTTSAFERKLNDRIHSIQPLLHPGMRVLEVGCAEGGLGAHAKALCKISYDGIEISRDAEVAATKLNQVFRTSAVTLPAGKYELILSFHVLEHIADIGEEIRAWRRCLVDEGQLIIEVPNGAGHPLLDHDRNAEHLHQFSVSSLITLLSHNGFETLSVTTGHYESAVYSDSIRIHARKTLPSSCRTKRLLERFRTVLPTPFLAYGIGGDFTNYVLPLLDHLPVLDLLDSSPEKWGIQVAGHCIQPYDPDRHETGLLLICSVRFRREIERTLRESGIASARLRNLEDIYDPT